MKLSRIGLQLWTAQLVMTITMNINNYLDSFNSPCNNALSCAVYIQVLLNGVTVVLQVLLVFYNRKHILDCLEKLEGLALMTEDLCGKPLSWKTTIFPAFYNAIFTLFTVGRCVFMFVMKPKTPWIQMVRNKRNLRNIKSKNI